MAKSGRDVKRRFSKIEKRSTDVSSLLADEHLLAMQVTLRGLLR